MDKNAIKKYAVWARNELIARVIQKAEQYEISKNAITAKDVDSIGGEVLSAAEKKQRKDLIEKIETDGFEQVMEEVAYMWFNRFTALRFMEVNNYLPSHIRVFTNEDGEFKPQILAEAIQLEMEGLDMEKVYELKEANKTEELYKYLLITQCNALSSILPGMFQKIAHYTELLLPDYLLRKGSVIEQMIALIPEEDWMDQVQIIGWLYQYYNSEKKDEVFAALKKNVKITKENIPAATQLFTPDWIVHYMVENSLGRLWLEGHPEVSEKFLPTEEELHIYAAGDRDPKDTKWYYYIEEAEQEKEVQEQLTEIRKEYATLAPNQLRVIDPCSGSGHILVYMFDVLMKIYESYGYTASEAVASIVEDNLYGLDIDDRAAQLAYFAVMMKARQYDRRFFSRGIQPHVYAVVESNYVDKLMLDYFCNGDTKLTAAMDTIINELHDAKEYGSILTVTPQDWSALYDRLAEITEDINMSREMVLREFVPMVQVAEALSQKYDVVVTNPPYMGLSNGDSKLNYYVKKEYPDGKADFCTCFMIKCMKMCKRNGKMSMINIPAWMSLVSFEKLRKKFIENYIIDNMLHFGRGIFGSDFGSVAFVLTKYSNRNFVGNYMRLFCKQGEVEAVEEKNRRFFNEKKYNCSGKEYLSIPGTPIAYWLSHNFFATFNAKQLGKVLVTREGMATADNDRFLRLWSEVNMESIGFGVQNEQECIDSKKKWFPYQKGGEYRKWYGNQNYLVNWENDGYEVKHNFDKKTGRLRSHNYNGEYAFRVGLTWTSLSISSISVRYSPEGFLFDSKGAMGFCNNEKDLMRAIALLNSKIGSEYLKIFSPTVDFKVGDVIQIPDFAQKDEIISKLTKRCIELSKEEWDSYETSWNFVRHPLIGHFSTIAEAFQQWTNKCNAWFENMKDTEEELNRILIDIYGLQDEITPYVDDKDITIRRAELGRDIRSFISYVVGCMFGRYSLNSDGVAYAGGKWDDSESAIFKIDKDNIIPISDDEYFEDDIVGRFVKFVEIVYGKDSLQENLKFIADALGGKGQPKDVIRTYFINEFFKDHCNIYQVTGSGKRPIYWLFDSGKKNGFKCLIYMHRYKPDTIARIRTDYVHGQQSRYRTTIANLEQRIAAASTSERVKLNKQLKKLNEQAAEIHDYEEKIHHLADQYIEIDLDDGVKHNYALFQDVLAKIK